MTMFLGRDSIQHRIVRGFFSTAGLALGLTAAALFATAFIQFKRVTDENLRLLAGVIGANSDPSLLFDDQEAAAETLRSDRRDLVRRRSSRRGRVFARYVRDGSGTSAAGISTSPRGRAIHRSVPRRVRPAAKLGGTDFLVPEPGGLRLPRGRGRIVLASRFHSSVFRQSARRGRDGRALARLQRDGEEP
jgi:hypothetical protein